ncbi:SGNH/GDSL hydrolase family protein, partial [Campylobacter upsaliensis]|nr:SGNH/GDSL hydrolase family protein [Campylobacter upsaliensis]
TILKNQKMFQNADLIVIETNINDFDVWAYLDFSFSVICRNFEALCRLLASFNTKILFLILPFADKKVQNRAINNFELYHIKKYGFNFIDMQNYYENKNLNDFYSTTDLYHQLESLMRELGKNIILNLKQFHHHKKDSVKLPNFIAKSPLQLFENLDKNKINFKENSLLNKEIYKLKKGEKLYFKKEFEGYVLIGLGIWLDEKENNYSSASFILQNDRIKIVKMHSGAYYLFHTFEKEFNISKQAFICFNDDDEKRTEQSHNLFIGLPYDEDIYRHIPNTLENLNLTEDFLLVKPDENFKIDAHYDFNVLANLEVQIDEKYNFSHLIPDVVLFKEIIEEYNVRMDPVKIAPLQAEIKNLKLELHQKKQNPIQTHLAYKLGRAIIENYRSFWGFLGLPFVLNYIAKKHKKEANILPCDESEKQIFSYQLGLALIKAHKAWYKGGYVWFMFEIFRLKKKFKL